jgi:chromate transporter
MIAGIEPGQRKMTVEQPIGRAAEVFRVFLRLGLTSFGGPIAHIGYFRHEFVERRKWLDEQAYADLVALCQFLPGPASSQVGFSLGLMRAGYGGALAAWTGFTLPSAIVLVLFAYGASALSGPVGGGLVHGLKLVAVAIVAQAVWGMARALCPDRIRASIAVVAALLILFSASSIAQIGAILLGGIAGLALCRAEQSTGVSHFAVPVSRAVGLAALAVFSVLLIGLPVLARLSPDSGIALFEAFYRSGALVFGGGHVVLPLLEREVVDGRWLDRDTFLAGYGLVQALPGPLFSFAGFVGAAQTYGPRGITGGLIALFAIYLPSLLLITGVLPFWDRLKREARARGAVAGAGATVVGVLAAALWDPVLTTTVQRPSDWALVAAAYIFLQVAKLPPWLVVIGFAIATGVFLR